MGGTRTGERALHPVAAVLAVLLGWVLMQVALVLALRLLGLGQRGALLAGEAALVLPGLGLLVLSGARPGPALGLFRLPAPAVALCLGCGLSLWAVSLGVMNLQTALVPLPPAYLELFQRLHAALRPRDLLDGLLSLAAIALAPALCEELLFRGTVLPSLARAWGATAGVVVSAVLFGAIHVDSLPDGSLLFFRVPFALVVGLGLALLRLRAGTLAAPMLAHGLLNAITFALAPLVDKPLDTPERGDALLGLALLAGGGLATAFLYRRLPPRQD